MDTLRPNTRRCYTLSMIRILVVGAGTFGRRAVDRLHRGHPSVEITLVDRDPSALARYANEPVRILCRDGIMALCEQMTGSEPPDRIVPAIPKHVAYEWMMADLKHYQRVENMPVPEPVFNRLPNAMPGPAGEAYMSNADFICPEDCPEPEILCSFTGKPRPRILHAYAAAVTYKNFRSIVIVSRQLAPGVGGYPPQALRDAKAAVEASAKPVLLTTACKCHGVMHAFKVRPDTIDR